MTNAEYELMDKFLPIMNMIVQLIAPHFVRTKTRGFECISEIPSGDNCLYEVEIKIKKVV